MLQEWVIWKIGHNACSNRGIQSSKLFFLSKRPTGQISHEISQNTWHTLHVGGKHEHFQITCLSHAVYVCHSEASLHSKNTDYSSIWMQINLNPQCTYIIRSWSYIKHGITLFAVKLVPWNYCTQKLKQPCFTIRGLRHLRIIH